MIAIVKSPYYEGDVTQIWNHIAQRNPDAADRVILAIEGNIELLSRFPRIGTPCPHLARRDCVEHAGESI
jgi:plasmid stabilization system protein ParE